MLYEKEKQEKLRTVTDVKAVTKTGLDDYCMSAQKQQAIKVLLHAFIPRSHIRR
jgi:hypothetical protein